MNNSPEPRSAVALEPCEAYDIEQVEAAVRRCIESLGGIERFVRPGWSVLLKPNMLSAAAPSRSVTTHPAVVEAVIRIVKDAGGHPAIGDSPALASFERVARKSGIAHVAERYDVPLVPFVASVPAAPPGRMFRDLDIARPVVEADAVINLPKLKAHGQMLMTIAVKNMFGCVVGRRKAEWHMRAGRDAEAFARLLIQVYKAARPALSIVDAVVGMEGNGPASGDPIQLGFIAASDDPIALDAVLCHTIGVNPLDVLTTKLGAEAGIGIADLDRIDIVGGQPGELKPSGFRLPRRLPIEFGPAWFRRLFRNTLRPRPVVDHGQCELCEICIDACPADAMAEQSGRVDIMTARCISCFCCQEVCPRGAISVRHGWISRVLFR